MSDYDDRHDYERTRQLERERAAFKRGQAEGVMMAIVLAVVGVSAIGMLMDAKRRKDRKLASSIL